MTTTSTLKTEWDGAKRNRFKNDLLAHGWEVIQALKGSIIYQKNATRIEVDNYGAFLFEFKITGDGGRFVRTQGITDERIDQGYSIGHDPNILCFKQARIVKRFDLVEATWVKR